MINILVPTDLSALAKVAATYAIKMGNKLNGNVTLLHVVASVQPVRASMQEKVKDLEKEVLELANSDLQALTAKLTKQSKMLEPLVCKVAKGQSFNLVVNAEAKKLETGLIVMGTRGANGLKKYIVGSNTTAIIEESRVPVLVVPEEAQFKAFRNVVYATDLKHTEKELRKLIPFLDKFGSTIHLIHIAASAADALKCETKIDKIVEKVGYKKVIVRVLVNKSIDKAINDYVTTVKADLLTTFTHEHSFYDKLFNRSVTRQAAFQSKVPLLAFKQR